MASSKRTDNKGRVLKANEQQRANGRYEYRYKNTLGIVNAVYAWRLVPTDKTPKGKPEGPCLRELEEEIWKDKSQGINTSEKNRVTLNEYFEKYYAIRKESWRQATQTNNKYLYERYCRKVIGNRKIVDLHYSDLRAFYVKLIDSGTLEISTLENVHGILHPTFQMAVRDDVLMRNPTDGLMGDIKKAYHWEKPKRHALTEPQQEAFIEYMMNSSDPYIKGWLPMFVTLLGTGGRIGEITGLRWQDIYFDKNYIDINHALIYRMQDDGHSEFHITDPKTSAGKRRIPMLTAVREVLEQEKDFQQLTGVYGSNFTVDGYTGFVFLNSNGRPHLPQIVNRAIKKICALHNAEEEARATAEGREPELLPDFTVHQLRHTFATRFCENETNLKVIQEIMGHSDITVTMNIYNEAMENKKEEAMINLDEKISILGKGKANGKKEKD